MCKSFLKNGSRLTQEDGTIIDFDSKGRVVRIKYPDGEECYYNGSGVLVMTKYS